MVFSDLFFLFVFLPAFMLCYRLAGVFDTRDTAASDPSGLRSTHPRRNIVLVVFSLLFYAWGEPVYVFLMVGSVAVNYLAGLWITRCPAGGVGRRFALISGLTVNVIMIGVFKYAGFIAEQLCAVGITVPVPTVALPIGISFYTFQSISYLVDVYRTTSMAQRRYTDLLLYISMFPQLIAGPIVRYSTVAREINNRNVSHDDVAEGVFRFMLGLGKKVILANQFSDIATGFLSSQGLPDITVGGAWIGILAFTFQIYFDFSGYSDMAIGIGRCLGFHFDENFDHPYISRSVTEFWRRWHMSLGSFFRDYVYIPLGGQPQPSDPQYSCGVVSHGALAWCKLEFRDVGPLLRGSAHGRKEIYPAPGRRYTPRRTPFLCHGDGGGRMGHILFRRSRPYEPFLPGISRLCPRWTLGLCV